MDRSGFMSMERVQAGLLSPRSAPPKEAAVGVSQGGESFEQILRQKNQLHLSKHAAMRLHQRGISLSEAQMQKLDRAASRAGDKGVSEGLVVMDGMAFIVHIPSKTIVTAVGSGQEAAVFTNIDGAVIV